MCNARCPGTPHDKESILVDVSTSKSQGLPCSTQHALGKLHTTEHHAQYINWGSLYAVKSQLLLRDRLHISQREVNNCFVHHFPFLDFILSVFLSPFSLLLISVIFHIISVIKLSSSQPMGFTFFPILLPLLLAGRGMRSVSVVLSCWLLLNHDGSQHACCALAHSLKMLVLRSCHRALGLPLFA